MRHLYTYNKETDNFLLVRHATIKRVGIFCVLLLIGIAIGIGLATMHYRNYTDPEQLALADENSLLRDKIKDINGRLTEAQEVMLDISQRDIEFYRVLLQCDTAPMRYTLPDLLVDNTVVNNDTTLILALEDNLSRLEGILYTQSKAFDHIKQLAAKRKIDVATIPAIMPVAENTLRHISSGFGLRTDPIYEVTRMHEGMDFAANEGTPIYATADGIVDHAGWANGYGECVYLKHGDRYSTRYGHMSSVLVHNGQHVKRGQLIGKVGNTGKSTGPHVHYEVRINGEAVNPVDYYFMDLTPREYEDIVRRAASANTPMD